MIFVQPGIVILVLAACLALPQTSSAVPAITCHCFTDRSYDAAHPAAADPYFLATTQNSFFAAVFNTDKSAVVMKKQQGASSDDLWVAYWIASRSGTQSEALLRAKSEKDTWTDALASLRVSRKALGPRFSAALDARSSTAALAMSVVDDLLLQYRMLTAGELTAMRKTGAGNQEVIIAALIAARTNKTALQIYNEVRAGGRTWGSLLSGAHMESKDIPRQIAAMIRSPER